MAEKGKKGSRRARRRAAKAEAEGTEEAAEEAAPEEEQAEDEGDEEEEEDDEGEGEGEEEEPPAKTKSAKIRDRNQRVRAQAAARRRARRDKERAAQAAGGLDTSEMVDDALARSTHAASKWLRANFKWVQWIVIALIAGGIGWQIYSWRTSKTSATASDLLLGAVLAENGRIGDPKAAEDPNELGVVDPRPIFETEAQRSEAAEKAYIEAAAKRPGSGTSILAELGLAGVLLDRGKWDEAKAKYESVKATPLAQHDVDVRGRAIEGIGMCLEAKKDTDGALKAYRELENTDAPGLKELGMYHQARLHYAKGEKDKAKELVEKVIEKTKPEKPRGFGQPPGYLEQRAKDLLAKIDPEAAKKASSPLGLPGGEGANVDEETLKLLKEVIGEAGGEIPGSPVPVPAPAGSGK